MRIDKFHEGARIGKRRIEQKTEELEQLQKKMMVCSIHKFSKNFKNFKRIFQEFSTIFNNFSEFSRNFHFRIKNS